jgi:hypothetical protein
MLLVQNYFRTTISSGMKWARRVACREIGDKLMSVIAEGKKLP